MRILYVSAFPNQYDQTVLIQRRKAAVLREVVGRGWQVLAVTAEQGDRPLELPGMQWEYQPLLFREQAATRRQRIYRGLWSATRVGRVIMAGLLARWVEEFRPNGIIVENWNLSWALLSCLRMEIPVVVRVYGVNVLPDWIDDGVRVPWRRGLLRKIQDVINDPRVRLVALNRSGSRAMHLVEAMRMPGRGAPGKAYLLPNVWSDEKEEGVRHRRGAVRRESGTILQVGRMSPLHRFDLGIRVAEEVTRRVGGSVRLVMLGDGPERQRVLEKAKESGRGSSKAEVIWAGRLSGEKLWEWYRRAEGLISFYGYNPLIEALSAGCWVVSREFGEVEAVLREQFSAECFQVVRVGEPRVDSRREDEKTLVSAMADAVVGMLERRGECRRIRRIRVDDFARQLVDDFERALRAEHL